MRQNLLCVRNITVDSMCDLGQSDFQRAGPNVLELYSISAVETDDVRRLFCLGLSAQSGMWMP